MQKFEYIFKPLWKDSAEEVLNAYGDKGYQVVGFSPVGGPSDAFFVILQRPVQELPEKRRGRPPKEEV